MNSILKHLWAQNVGKGFQTFERDCLAKLCWGWDRLQKSLYLLKEAFCQISKVSKSSKLPFGRIKVNAGHVEIGMKAFSKNTRCSVRGEVKELEYLPFNGF